MTVFSSVTDATDGKYAVSTVGVKKILKYYKEKCNRTFTSVFLVSDGGPADYKSKTCFTNNGVFASDVMSEFQTLKNIHFVFAPSGHFKG